MHTNNWMICCLRCGLVTEDMIYIGRILSNGGIESVSFNLQQYYFLACYDYENGYIF